MKIENDSLSNFLNLFKIDLNTELAFSELEYIKEEELNILIYCNNLAIGNSENRVIEKELSRYFANEKYLSKYQHLNIILYFNKTVQHFSLSLFQTIFSFLYNYRLTKNIKYLFIGSDTNASYTMIQSLFGQYLTYTESDSIVIYMVNKSLKIVKWGKKPVDQDNIPSNTKYVISNSFLPIICVNKLKDKIGVDNFIYFFKKNISDLLDENKNQITEFIKEKDVKIKRKDEEGLFKEIYLTFLKSPIYADKEKFKSIYFLFYYIKIWSRLGFLSDYNNNFENISTENKLNKGLKSLKTKLERQPLFKILLFHLLIDENYIFNRKQKKTILNSIDNTNLYLTRINQILSTTDLIFDAIYELVKNIKNHAKDNFGFVSLRKYKNEMLRNLYNIQSRSLEKNLNTYFEQIEDKLPRTNLLEILVSDDGYEGLLTTGLKYLKEIETNFKSTLLQNEKNEIIHQIKNIEKRINDYDKIAKICFDSFYSEESFHQGRQLIKSAAGFGLLIFMNRIKSLNGSFILSSNYNDSQNGFFCYYTSSLVEKCVTFADFFAQGTNYHIILPLDIYTDEEFLPKPKSDYSFEDIYSGSNVVYEHLLKIKKTYKKEFSKRSLLEDINNDFDLLDYLLINDKIISESFRNLLIGNRKILSFDLSRYEKDASDLLRFLAKLQFNIKGINAIVLYNDQKIDRVKKIIEILKICSTIELDFWSDRNAILYYYFCDESELDCFGLQYSFLIFGETWEQFLKINHELKAPHFTKIPYKYNLDQNLDSHIILQKENIPLFVGNSPNQMLYFHLLLETKRKYTIFETNVSVLLNRKIED